MSASAPPPQGLLLPDATIEQLHEAAVTAGLAPRRQTLLAGIDPAFVTSLDDDAPNPASRLVSDLHALNRVKELTDGTVPLAIWLSNAKRIAKSRVEAEVFRRALEEITPHAGKCPAPPPPPQQRSSALLVTMALAGVALAAALLYAFLPPSRSTPAPNLSPPPTSAKIDPPPTTAPPQSSSVTSAPTVPTTTIPLSPAAKPSAKAALADTAASAPSASPPPPSAPPPSGVRSGTATCTSATSCTLGGAPLDPSLARVCLDAPGSAAELAGHIPVCTISAGNVCFISRPPLTKPLLSPVTWRPCSP